MGNVEKYYVGLDMGTSSVGWAVTNAKYELRRAKGRNLWGVRLFDEAETSAERRTYRVARRRRQREKARMGVLRELFAEEIEKVDPGFYARLDDSRYYVEDRREDNKQPYALFADTNYTDKDYYRDYPTIFHLRKELIESDQPHDIRLVYLALANMFKHRGHFLNTSLDSEDGVGDFAEIYAELCEKASELDIELPYNIETEELARRLGEKGRSRTQIMESVTELLDIRKSDKKKKPAYQLLGLMCGLSVKLIDIFGDEVIDEEHKKLSLSFRVSNYEEVSEEVREVVGDEHFELILSVKALHDIGLLSHILKGYPYLSQARVDAYECHQADLKQLKRVLKKYAPQAYHDMFRIMEEGNYSAYVGSVNSSDTVVRRITKGRGKDEFYKKLQAILKNLPQDDVDVKDMLEKIDADLFLPKQLTNMNGVIPNQVHAREMKAILGQAEKYHPFLLEKDESGLTVSERIVRLFTFRIPYYVGPLGQEYKDKPGYNVWAERKEPGRIYPWNFEDKIDVKTTAEKFIGRMVRHCTYLSEENALPKQSLLYEKFEVLNELNNLRINGEKPSVERKQDIYRALFTNGKKVTLRRLTDYLISNGLLKKGEEQAVTGIDGGFHSSLSTLGKFRGILGEGVFYDENQKMMEDIAFWGTIYGNDKKFLKERMEEVYGSVLSEKDQKRILGFKFDGWGKLSAAFLNMEGCSKEDGVVRSLIGALWETNDNIMELLSERYTYADALREKVKIAEKPLTEWQIEDLDGMYLSAPVKRMVWQTMKILQEVETVLGKGPDRIFVEMAREEDPKKERKESRKQKLSALYKAIKSEEKAWRKEIEDKPEGEFRSKKLYLYYMQTGRCMYTGERIHLDDLMNDNLYDIDHIYPRHFVKDDSIENNLVLVKKEKNAHKSDVFPIEQDVREKMYATWKSLMEQGFITPEKFRRLTRTTKFTDEEKADFISRQIVETRQGTKAITQILGQAFPESEIVFAKAGNVSEFRHKYDLYKVRCVNDLHHAQDAYLNIVVGNTYYVKFTKSPINFIKDAQKHGNDPRYQYNMDKIFDWNVERNGERAWTASKKGETAGTIALVKKVMEDTSPLVTRMCVEAHGGITRKATIWSAETAKGQGYIPVKMSDPRLQDVTKYGGFTAISVAGYTLVEYCLNGKKVRSLEALPIYLGRSETLTDEQLKEYFYKELKKENSGKEITGLRICYKLIPAKSLVKYNGFYYYLGGKTGPDIWVNNAMQLCLKQNWINYVKKIEKAISTNNYEERDKAKQLVLSKGKNQELYQILKDKLTKTIFLKHMGPLKRIIVEKENEFCELSVKDQCYIISKIFGYYQSGTALDLRLLGQSENTGKTKISRIISKAEEVILIHQSVTGLFRTETDLLKV
ncbi:MAG: type II CRISPR RNA-guided endonuclease Cas9 [Lachnospiraceae bacterium]|nr:type II CRISPR RNA-guided endonuclease Cas9 [Lachnospiraceae bacterium]